MNELDKNYEIILGYEEHFAYALGREVIDKPKASAWMVLLPILFVDHAYRVNRYKAAVRAFAQGVLDSKQKALGVAFEELQSGRDKEIRTEELFPEMGSASEQDRGLAEKQVRVTRIQQGHYRRMLSARGKTYGDLLRSVYPEARQYRSFLNELAAAEHDLNRYLTEWIYTDESSVAVVRKMEECSDQYREQEIKMFY